MTKLPVNIPPNSYMKRIIQQSPKLKNYNFNILKFAQDEKYLKKQKDPEILGASFTIEQFAR